MPDLSIGIGYLWFISEADDERTAENLKVHSPAFRRKGLASEPFRLKAGLRTFSGRPKGKFVLSLCEKIIAALADAAHQDPKIFPGASMIGNRDAKGEGSVERCVTGNGNATLVQLQEKLPIQFVELFLVKPFASITETDDVEWRRRQQFQF